MKKVQALSTVSSLTVTSHESLYSSSRKELAQIYEFLEGKKKISEELTYDKPQELSP
jgi:hypothetical protein